MPAARSLVRNTSGFQGKDGHPAGRRARADRADRERRSDGARGNQARAHERKITPHIKFSYEFTGESKETVQKRQTGERKGRDYERAGIHQASS